MSTPKVTDRLFIDTVELATLIERRVGIFLQPPVEGLYMLGEVEPIMVPNRTYYQAVMGGRLQRIDILRIEDIFSDVYDSEHKLLFNAKKRVMLRESHTYPVRGMRIISAMVDWVLDAHSDWSNRDVPSLDSLLRDFFIGEEEYRVAFLAGTQLGYLHEEQNKPYYQAVTERIVMIQNMFEGTEKMIEQFIGDKFDDRWVMHFAEPTNGTDILITKTIDYRIHQWERTNGYHNGTRIYRSKK
jgi:hypothetical protein